MKKELPDDGFRDAVTDGLGTRPRRIPCRFLYDAEGSGLFERITETREYYPTRTETGILEHRADEIARMVGPGARVVEFGAGTMRKTRLLLDALPSPAAYIPIDVARDTLILAARRLGGEHPGLVIEPLVADYMRPVTLPPAPGAGPVLGFFPGSSIGNLQPAEARDFLRRAARLVGPDGWLLVGVDTVKDKAVLEAAYDDAEGVTAAFLRNLLARANRELDGDFDLDGFDHAARWNARECRVEIHLVSNRRQTATVAGMRVPFRTGDTIHVEDCYKYAVPQFHWLARQGGFTPHAWWTDPQGWFSIHLLKSGGKTMAVPG